MTAIILFEYCIYLFIFSTVVSSDPVLDLLPTLERRLQETNNMAAFLANVRKEFVSHARG